jgi:hypothetical protein
MINNIDPARVAFVPRWVLPPHQAKIIGEVIPFKACGWPGPPHVGGIVHHSPRISGNLTQLLLVLDASSNGR